MSVFSIVHRQMLCILGAVAVLTVPAIAFAVDSYPPIICNQLFGCGKPPEDVILTSTLPLVGSVMVQLAAGGAVLAIVIAGVMMTLSAGDDGKITSARKAIMFALGGLALALTATSLVSFVTTENYGQADPDLLFGAGGVFSSVLRIILILFNVGFVIVVIIGGIHMITSMGSAEGFKKGGSMIKWAVIGALIVNLARAVVQAFLALQL